MGWSCHPDRELAPKGPARKKMKIRTFLHRFLRVGENPDIFAKTCPDMDMANVGAYRPG